MGFPQDDATTVYKDITTCIEWGKNIISGCERANIRKHFMHQAIKNGHMILLKIATTSQLADIMTKGDKLPQWKMCVTGLLGQPLEPSKSVVAQEGGD
jgi:hypothetical protein